MPKCFLSYSSSYGHLKEPFRHLLEALGFETPVEVFDGPDLDAIPEVVIQKIKGSDAVVILYGPNPKPSNNSKPGNKQKSFKGAKWPHEEALLARGMGKPIVMIVHTGTALPVAFEGYSTPARFDFWDPQSFIENIHHVVKLLSDFKKRMEDLPGEQPFKVKNAVCRQRILTSDLVKLEIYNEVVARKKWGVIQHRIDHSYDKEVSLPSPEKLQYELEKRVGPESQQVAMKFGNCTAHSIEYFIIITPDIEPGQELGYWRTFQLPIRFPLTRLEAKVRRDNIKNFPNNCGPNSYGDSYPVTNEIDNFTFALHFPRSVRLTRYCAFVLHCETQQENKDETERCKSVIRLLEEPDMEDRILEIKVHRPLINHAYYLLYEPAL